MSAQSYQQQDANKPSGESGQGSVEPQYRWSCLGQIRKFQSLDKFEVLFVFVSCQFIVLIAGLSIYKMTIVGRNDTDFTFSLFVLCNMGFCVFYVIHGVLGERPYEIVLFLTAVVAVLIYTVLNYCIAYDDRGPYKLARLITVSVMFLLLFPLCCKYIKKYLDFRPLICDEIVNTSVELQDACKTLFVFHEFLKLDLQLGIGIVILILNSTDDIKLDDYIVLPVGLVFNIIWFVIGFVGSRKESSNCMLFFYITSPLEPAYILYKIIMSAEQVGLNLKGASIACGCVALVTRIIVLIISCLVYKNFGKQLKDFEYHSL